MDNKSYRIRTNVGSDEPFVIDVPIDQSYDTLEILSLKIGEKNLYKLYDCGYGVIVGRVIANGNFGIPNARISVFIPFSGDYTENELKTIYDFTSTETHGGDDGKIYNLLPDYVDKSCHQDIGSFKKKVTVLDNDDVIEVFDKYYKYTTRTNDAGDYMLYGIPTGENVLHVDIDLSDIGILSQTPRDMMYNGYPADLFESPTKFKKDDGITNLAQVKRYTKTVYVSPFWGDTTDESNPDNASVNRVDFNIDYTFKTCCIFMGSVVTDGDDNSVSHNCRATEDLGKMSQLTTSEGMIEMIRYTPNNKIEEATVKGEKLIDNNGTWCYQIPMNLDYMMTDEFGKMVPTDDPNKGIPTRARVRFRISMTGNEGTSKTKTARYLVPNNPEPQYYDERGYSFDSSYVFGTTNEGDYRDLYWNCVYTVKSFIPRLQKGKSPNDRKYVGIKGTNMSGDNNPMPFNSISFKLGFRYRFMCFLLKFLITVVYDVNVILSLIGGMFGGMYRLFRNIGDKLNMKLFCACRKSDDDTDSDDDPSDDADPRLRDCRVCEADENPSSDVWKLSLCGWFYSVYSKIGCGIGIQNICDNDTAYYPGCWEDEFNHYKQDVNANSSNHISELFQCVENNLAHDNDVVSFDFSNDWVNGVLYFPKWYRRIRPRRTFYIVGLGMRGSDRWCSYGTKPRFRKLKLYKTCSLKKTLRNNKKEITPYVREDFPRAINPIPGLHHTYLIPDHENEKITIGYFAGGFDESNCYGFRCHKSAVSFVNEMPGIIYERETELGDNVYYYVAGDFKTLKDSLNKDVNQYVKMFSTDIVLLGSLDTCGLQGIPQFFKRLFGITSTYNMPGDVWESDGTIVENDSINIDNDTDSGSVAFVDGTKYTASTGADWGGNAGPRQCEGEDTEIHSNDFSPERYADGGLFYGLTCSNAYTKPKTCVNLERVCEYGVGLDVAHEIVDDSSDAEESDNNENVLIPDGYIGYDDIVDHDGRSEFTTMNSNGLRTVIDNETGFPVYDFTNHYVDNFDGTAYNLMGNALCKCPFPVVYDGSVNYSNNYLMEINNVSYSKFRYGDTIRVLGRSIGGVNNMIWSNQGTVNTTRTTIGYVSTQNSYYFYFGLRDGNTAIDRFQRDYFGNCEDKDTEANHYEIDSNPRSWCGDDDTVYISMYLNGIDTPYMVELKRDGVTVRTDINLYDEKIYWGSCQECADNGYTRLGNLSLINGNYKIIVTDALDNERVFDVMLYDEGFSAQVHGVGYGVSNDEIYTTFNYPSYDDACIDYDRYSQGTGGYLVLYPPYFTGGGDVQYYKVDVTPRYPSFFPDVNNLGDYTGCSFNNYGDIGGYDHDGHVWNLSGSVVLPDPDTDGAFVVGIPKNGTSYNVKFTQMCNEGGNNYVETSNVYQTTIYVKDSLPLTMTVNGIDHEIIKNFESGYEVNQNNDFTQFDANSVSGWNSLADIGVYEDVEDVDFGIDYSISYTIQDAIHVTNYASSVIKNNLSHSCKYNFPTNCFIEASDMLPGCVTVVSIPSVVDENSPQYIYVIGDTFYVKSGNSYLIFNYGLSYYNFVYSNISRINVYNAVVTAINNRKEFSRMVRMAFTNSEIDYSMEIGYEGGFGIVSHNIYHQVEDNDLQLLNLYENENIDNSVNGQTIRTLSFDSNGFMSYRKPYLFGVEDDIHTSVPLGFDTNTIPNNEMFQAHMLDKGLTPEYEVWLPKKNSLFWLMTWNIKDIHFPLQVVCGEMVDDRWNLDGFIAANIINGISTKIGYNDSFEESYLLPSNTHVPVNTIHNHNSASGSQTAKDVDESAYQTDRYLSHPDGITSSCFENYKIYNGINDTLQCMPLYVNGDDSYKLSDGMTEYNIDLFKDFSVVIDPDYSYVPSYTEVLGHSGYGFLKFNFTGGITPDELFLIPQTRYPYQYNQKINCAQGVITINQMFQWKNCLSTLENYQPHYGLDGTYNFECSITLPDYFGPNCAYAFICVAIKKIGRGRYFYLSDMIDLSVFNGGTRTYIGGNTSIPVGILLYESGATSFTNNCGGYIKNYNYEVLVYDRGTNNLRDTFVLPPVLSLSTSNRQWTIVLEGVDYHDSLLYDIYIKDITGLRHKI